jgi:biotin carboxyl carrier protein
MRGTSLRSRKVTLRSGERVYELEFAGPDPEGEITLGGAWRTDLEPQPRDLPELRARISSAGGGLRLSMKSGTERLAVLRQDRGVWVAWRGRVAYVEQDAGRWQAASPGVHSDEVRAPMAGTLVELRAAPGQHVIANEVLAVMEAMKMEYRLVAPRAGEVAEVPNQVGSRVELGATVIRLKPVEGANENA